MTKRTGIAVAGLLLTQAVLAGADRLARVDAEGVLRWTDTGGEVALLGVNYYTPFTIDHAALKRLGLDHRQVMRDDVAHFRRLGLSCIRVHCFERQFSDREGNLLDNEHLALLDELIDVCREQGLYTVLTPIAWWGGGVWTERTQGFSDVYPMRQLTADRATWPAQARFLKQFAKHVNRITGRRYADDPCVLAFECINEPLYPPDTPDSLVTDYINTLTDALRASGTAKPVYYNAWQGRNAAAGASRADGVTCVTYPTGLVAGPALGRAAARPRDRRPAVACGRAAAVARRPAAGAARRGGARHAGHRAAGVGRRPVRGGGAGARATAGQRVPPLHGYAAGRCARCRRVGRDLPRVARCG